jgi:hypothetical protein
MFGWFKRRAETATAPQSLAPNATREQALAWALGLTSRCRGKDGAVRALLDEARPQLDAWYAGFPIEVRWAPGLDGLRVVDPLPITTDELLVSEDPWSLLPWATLVRSLVIVTGGAGFHHGCMATDLVALLEHPRTSRRIEVLQLPSFDLMHERERDELVARLVAAPNLRELAHLRLTSAGSIRPEHLTQLTHAPWASSLRTLDITELMVDWAVDLEPAERHTLLRDLGRFDGLTHLVLYNDLAGADDLAVLLAHLAPSVTHLELGRMPGAADWLDVLADAAPRTGLEHVSLGGGPPRTHPAWDRLRDSSVPFFVHGRRVDADYPAR